MGSVKKKLLENLGHLAQPFGRNWILRGKMFFCFQRQDEALFGCFGIFYWTKYVTLLLPGEMNILQIQCKIDFNTFLLHKPHSRCIKWLGTMLMAHVGWLLGIPGHHWWLLVLTGNIWWLGTIFGVLFITLSLNNALFCVIFCYL